MALCDSDGKVLAVHRPERGSAINLIPAASVLDLFDGFEHRYRDFIGSDRARERLVCTADGEQYAVRLLRMDEGESGRVLVEMEPAGDRNEKLLQREAGRLVSRLLHDFKNQIGGIKLYVAYLRKVTSGQREVGEIVEKVAAGVDALVEQAALVSTLTRPMTIKAGLNDLSQIARKAVEGQAGMAEARGLKIVLNASIEPISLNCDPERMQTAISGVLARGIAAAPPDSRIEISLGIVDGKAEIEVRDAGTAPDQGRLASMFDIVGQDRLNAIGLGVALARRIVELHGGSVSAKSSDNGDGTTLTIEIPMGDSGLGEKVK